MIGKPQMNNSASTVVSSQHSLDYLLVALEQTDSYSYLSQISKVYGFPAIRNGFDSGMDSIKETINNPSANFPNANLTSLVKMIDRIIISGSHYYAIDTYTTKDIVKDIGLNLSSFKLDKEFAQLYPQKKYDGNSTGALVSGIYLTEIIDVGDGTAFIFSYLYNQKVKGTRGMGSTNIPQQSFTTAFIPNKGERIEFRASRSLGKRESSKAIGYTRDKFLNLLDEVGIKPDVKTVNFIKAIQSILNDVAFGRAVQLIYNGKNTGYDVGIHCRSDENDEGREIEIKNTKKKDTFVIRSIAVRFKNQNNSFTELGLDPNKKMWVDHKVCGEFYVDFPDDTLNLNRLIENVIARA
ncbi:hypothetical protein [Pantoea sp. At-9b]|uniref:hypothetical protein n=1 Tax=Pantoea sp. (strain At-9b) TaxID=592316 RepID=UPI0001F2600C|nr:hypothetical protein [Pantoea sp. At-9b]ADU71571.1 hypothetical protein Pat9b_5414 [Pantoea sp. At-9b]